MEFPADYPDELKKEIKKLSNDEWYKVAVQCSPEEIIWYLNDKPICIKK